MIMAAAASDANGSVMAPMAAPTASATTTSPMMVPASTGLRAMLASSRSTATSATAPSIIPLATVAAADPPAVAPLADPVITPLAVGDEPAIQGTIITLLDANTGQVLATTTTNANGFYQFGNLPAGNYRIKETQPLNFLDGKDTPGTPFIVGQLNNDDMNQILVPVAGTPPTVSQDGVLYNFGELLPNHAEISGHVYVDTNCDGIEQATETSRIQGVTIQLFDANNLTTPIASTTTDANGFYRFDLPNASAGGKFVIRELQPSGFLEGGVNPGTPFGGTAVPGGALQSGGSLVDAITNVVLPPVPNGQTASGINYNFGECKSGNVGAARAFISGHVYLDANCNGVEDAVETRRIKGVQILLFKADDLNSPIASTTTDANGFYRFELPNASSGGQFVIQEMQPAGFQEGGTNPGTPFGGTALPGAPLKSTGSPIDRITNIVLPPVPDNTTLEGIEYNFGECRTGKGNFLGSSFADATTP